MRRKVFSTEFIVSLLIALTSCIMVTVFVLQARNVKILYGSSVREAVYDLNEALGRTEDLLAEKEPAALMENAAAILGAKMAGELHPEIEAGMQETAEALMTYGKALAGNDYSESGLKLLEEDCQNRSDALKLLVQHAISRLYKNKTIAMDKAYYKAMSPGTKLYKEITLLAEHTENG